MCGIAGIIDIENKPIQATELLAMNQAIAHRGPDDEGYILIDQSNSHYRNFAGNSSPVEIKDQFPTLMPDDCFPGHSIGLAHRRFSIIDLSANGHQPFFSKDGSCCLTFNGEIYNYLEVRDELLAAGVTFSTQSDTEVFLEAYKYWGTECFSRFNGFWAIALYDFKRKQLIISRDRIGKKPLYWTKAGKRIYFASEIKALLRVDDIRRNRQVNEESIYQWLAFGRKDLNSTTCFAGIQSLPSASWTVVNEDFPNNINIFWSVPKERMTERDISTTQAADALRDLLTDSVKIRLRSDVPLSVELSGGMDSSTLVALAAQVHPGKITTYTVRFPEKQWNEEPFARSVALHYNTDYRVLDSPIGNFWSQILAFTYLEEEPYHSPNLQTNQVIWARMRSMGTKVSLNGAGGDENFAGYGGSYMAAQVENLLAGRLSAYFQNATKYSAGRTNIRAAMNPLMGLTKELAKRILPDRSLGNGKCPSYFKGKHYPSLPEPVILSQTLYSDMTDTLMPYWLRSGDRGYMGIPLEVRAPFLDYRVIEFAFRLPITYLLRDGWHKWILRKAAEDLLPADVIWRRRKMGFPFPVERFYLENQSLLDLLFARARNPYIDLSKARQFRHDWKTISFILWYELFFNENSALLKEIEAKARQMHSAEDYGYAPQFLSSRGIAVE